MLSPASPFLRIHNVLILTESVHLDPTIPGTPAEIEANSRCPSSLTTRPADPICIGAFAHVHVSPNATGTYIENSYFSPSTQVYANPTFRQWSVYSGRGVLVEAQYGPTFLYNILAEGNSMYQYQFRSARDVFAAAIASTGSNQEGNPAAPGPVTVSPAWGDPNFAQLCSNRTDTELRKCRKAYGLRIVNSTTVIGYGMSLVTGEDARGFCLGGPWNCQDVLISVEGLRERSGYADLFAVTTVGARWVVREDGRGIIDAWENGARFIYSNGGATILRYERFGTGV